MTSKLTLTAIPIKDNLTKGEQEMGEEAVEKHLKQIVDVLEMRMSEMGRALGVPESPLPEFKSTDPYLSAAEESLMRSYMTIENVLHHMTYITDAIHKLTGRIDGSQSIK